MKTLPSVPEVPFVPDVPLEPELPLEPEVPSAPEVPEDPEVPSAPDVPVVPDVPDIIYNDVNMPTLPSYNAPPMIIDYPGVESYFNVEDGELVTPAISKVTQQISEFNALSKDEHQRVQTELKEYDNGLQRRMKDAEGSLQGDIAQYQRRIEKYYSFRIA